MSDQAAVVELLRVMGCFVSVKSENRKARGSKGHPDCLVMHPRFPAPLALEHKRRYEAVSPEQREFERWWTLSHGLYLRGDYDDTEAFLRTMRVIAL